MISFLKCLGKFIMKKIESVLGQINNLKEEILVVSKIMKSLYDPSYNNPERTVNYIFTKDLIYGDEVYEVTVQTHGKKSDNYLTKSQYYSGIKSYLDAGLVPTKFTETIGSTNISTISFYVA